MSPIVSFVPELLSIIAAAFSIFTLRKFGRTYQKYSLVVAEMQEMQALEEASDRLASLRIKAENNDFDELLQDTEFLAAVETGFDTAFSSELTKLDALNEASEKLLGALEKKPSFSRSELQEILKKHESVGQMLAKRSELLAKMKEDLRILSAITDDHAK